MRRLIALKILTYLVLLLFSYLAFPTQSWAEVGDVNYISDVLKVPLRSGPSAGHRIVHRGLPSGTHMTVLKVDEAAGFTQVRTQGGTEGWVRSQYLVGEPIASVKLESAQKRLQRLEEKMDKERKVHAAIQSEYKEVKANNQTLNSRVQVLTKELEELKRVSADPINEHARNVELTEQNERLSIQVSELSSTARRLEENVQREWLVYGGALVLIGLLLGVVLKARPKRSSYSRYS